MKKNVLDQLRFSIIIVKMFFVYSLSEDPSSYTYTNLFGLW